MRWDCVPHEGDMKFELYRSGDWMPKYHQTMNLQNVLSNLGIVTTNIRIEDNSVHLCPDIHIDGYLDREAAFVGEKIVSAVSDFVWKSMTMDPFIKKVIFNPPATVILWADGTKTVVKCGEHDEFDPEKGLVMAITKKLLGNKGNYYNIIKNLLKEADYQYDRDDSFWNEYKWSRVIPRTVVKKIRIRNTPNSCVRSPYFECPLCGDEILKSGARYCANCGQRLMWEEK